MRNFVVALTMVSMLCGLSGCMQMPSKVERKGTTQFTNPSKHHPYPVSSKNRSNQKH